VAVLASLSAFDKLWQELAYMEDIGSKLVLHPNCFLLGTFPFIGLSVAKEFRLGSGA